MPGDELCASGLQHSVTESGRLSTAGSPAAPRVRLSSSDFGSEAGRAGGLVLRGETARLSEELRLFLYPEKMDEGRPLPA